MIALSRYSIAESDNAFEVFNIHDEIVYKIPFTERNVGLQQVKLEIVKSFARESIYPCFVYNQDLLIYSNYSGRKYYYPKLENILEKLKSLPSTHQETVEIFNYVFIKFSEL